MKKVCLVLSLLIPCLAVMAYQVDNLRPMENNVDILDMTELALPSDTIAIILDEGHGGTGFGLDAGDMIAVQFTPPQYPFTLLAAGYAAVNWGDREDDWNAPCFLNIYAEGIDGKPGEEIGQFQVQAGDSSIVNLFDLSIAEIVVNSGSFFCAVENITDIDPSVLIDIGSPVHRAGWFYEDVGSGVQWYHFSELISEDYPDMNLDDTLDPIIRVIGVIPGGIVELEPDVVEIAPTATVVASQGTINYTLNEPGEIEMTLWDGLGRKVKTVYSGYADAGEYTLDWNSADLPRGTYFICMKALNTVTTAKVVLIE